MNDYKMDSNAAADYMLNHDASHSADQCYMGKEGSDAIDLGLSLRTLQPQSYYHSPHENYVVLVGWNQLENHHKQLKCHDDQESQGLSDESRHHHHHHHPHHRQQQHRTTHYIKVNMDGVLIGRKICILHHMNYLSLALHLEEMFGQQTVSGLRLFEDESSFGLIYKDGHDQWRNVGDIPWKEFVDCVRRIRIVRKSNEAACSIFSLRTWLTNSL